MFVRKSTHDTVVRQLAEATALIEKQGEALRDGARRHAITEREACGLAAEVGKLRTRIETAEARASTYRSDLGKAWVRNARGQLERHPLNTERAKPVRETAGGISGAAFDRNGSFGG